MRSFLTSSRHRLPKPTLLGYAFHGVDLILDDDGLAAYGQPVPPGGEGSYVTVSPVRGGVAVGTDRTGYSRLFVYQDAHRWIVGSSFIEIVEHAAANGWKVTPSVDHLLSFTLAGAVANQLTTHQTSVAEVYLLPANEWVHLSGGLRKKLTRQRHTAPEDGSYLDHLGLYVNELVGRMRTLLGGPHQIVSDLTGGQDSRILLAALLRAKPEERSLGELVRFRSDLTKPDDLVIASHLSAKHDLNLNGLSAVPSAPLSTVDALDRWRRNDLGVYGPTYLPLAVSRSVSMGGGGGEGHRLFFKSPSIGHLLERSGGDNLDPDTFAAIRDQIECEIEGLGDDAEKGLDPRIRYYRYFRDRLHSGRQSLRSVMVSPLASKGLRAASNVLSPALRERGQVSADLMVSLAPHLATEPFETPKKAFDGRHFDDATDVSESIDDGLRGRVFGGARFDAGATGARTTAAENVTALREMFREQLSSARASGWLSDSYLDAASDAVDTAAQCGKFTHATHGQPVHVAILTGELQSLATQ